jgi:hypothetical protein
MTIDDHIARLEDHLDFRVYCAFPGSNDDREALACIKRELTRLRNEAANLKVDAATLRVELHSLLERNRKLELEVKVLAAGRRAGQAATP